MEYYLLTSRGREGPYQEAELLDLLDAGEISAEELCEQLPSGERRAVGDWFEVLEPETELENEPSPERLRGRAADRISNQVVQWEGRPSLLVHWPQLAMAAGGVWVGDHYERVAPGSWIVGLSVAALIVVLVLLRLSRWRYRVTGQGVEALRGWWFQDSWAIPLDEVSAIRVLHPGLSGLIGVGEVQFAAGDGMATAVVFWGLRKPRQVKELVEACSAGLRE
jgi:membrane protein YdbS with pleckstrin-like domain